MVKLNSVAFSEEQVGPLKANAVILFQGDSITDDGRDRRGSANEPAMLGRGYAIMIAGELLRDYASSTLTIYNRGIAGNRVPDLQSRWQTDCIDLKPDVLSLLIGVNDWWFGLQGLYDGTDKTYEAGYRTLLQQTREQLPTTRIVLCEPFVLQCGKLEPGMHAKLQEHRAAAAKLAQEFELTFVRFQTMFDEATKLAPPEYWAPDGVHPSLAGHALMAKTWRETTEL